MEVPVAGHTHHDHERERERLSVCFSHLGLREREEREKFYIYSSYLGLIRCLTLRRVGTMVNIQTISDEHSSSNIMIMLVILPHEMNHSTVMGSKQRRILMTNSLQGLKH
jgi:hypothetical protein